MTHSAKRAKILTPDQLQHLLHYIAGASQDPLRDYVTVLLSFKAGLRAQEIAGLDWADVTDAMGKVGQVRSDGMVVFTVPGDIAKKGDARVVPLHPVLHGALEHLQQQLGPAKTRGHLPVIQSKRTVLEVVYDGTASRVEWVPEWRMTPNALQRYLGRLYAHAGLQDCTSHSGRRTFVTAAVRAAGDHGCTLFDVQRIVGHKDAETTEAYVEVSPNIDKLVRAI